MELHVEQFVLLINIYFKIIFRFLIFDSKFLIILDHPAYIISATARYIHNGPLPDPFLVSWLIRAGKIRS